MAKEKRPRCAALVAGEYHNRQCQRAAIEMQKHSRPVCAQHAKQYDKWVAEGRDIDRMVAFWWGWR